MKLSILLMKSNINWSFKKTNQSLIDLSLKMIFLIIIGLHLDRDDIFKFTGKKFSSVCYLSFWK